MAKLVLHPYNPLPSLATDIQIFMLEEFGGAFQLIDEQVAATNPHVKVEFMAKVTLRGQRTYESVIAYYLIRPEGWCRLSRLTVVIFEPLPIMTRWYLSTKDYAQIQRLLTQ